MITHVTKEQMLARWGAPYLGYTCNRMGGTSDIWLRSDIPARVQASVKAHELQHVSDRAFLDGRVWHWEFRAWVAGFKASPPGFVQSVWMSVIDKERIKLYWQRITKNF